MFKGGMQGIILAGGRGTRLKSVVADRPKPMVSVLGKPFIEWIIDYLKRFGIENFVVSLGYLPEVAQAYFAQRPTDNARILTVVEEAPLGTGGGVMFARMHSPMQHAYLITNGDSLLLSNLEPAIDLFWDDNVDGVIIGRVMEDASRYGSLSVDDNNRLLGFSEKVQGRGLINGGIYLLKDRVLSLLPADKPFSIETEGFPFLLEKGTRLYVWPCGAPFIDIGTPETYLQAEQFIKQYWKELTC